MPQNQSKLSGRLGNKYRNVLLKMNRKNEYSVNLKLNILQSESQRQRHFNSEYNWQSRYKFIVRTSFKKSL